MIGQTLSHFKITASLGQGGMGEVYLAEDTQLGREVAIKVLPADMAADSERLERFQREAKALAALNHPNIVTIHSIEIAGEVPFMAMELVKGQTLSQLTAEGPLSVERFLEIADAIVDALAAAHDKGITHRDLKPANIMLNERGRVKVLDFGLAKLLEDEDPDSISGESITKALTQMGTALGTVEYMSPEQMKGEPADQRSDIFSLGIVFYCMLAGKHPFKKGSSAELISSLLRDEPESLTELRPDLPPQIEQIVSHCLEKKARDRFQSAVVLHSAIEGLRQDLQMGQTGMTGSIPALQVHPEKRKSPIRWIVLGLVILAIGAVLSIRGGFWQDAARSGPALPPSTTLAETARPTIAVLPLKNFSGDVEQDYFADGLTDALITDLAKVGALKVISRTTMMQYKNSDKSLREIARELQASCLVEGSVFRSSNRVRINAKLVDAQTDEALWGEEFERDLSNILELQSEVARAIATSIEVALTPEEERRLTTARAVNPEAHDAYLKGRFYWLQQNDEAVKQSLGYFHQALATDPEFAPAYVGLADSHILSTWAGVNPVPVATAYPKAKAAALKALEIDDQLAQAHVSLALTQWRYDWDWPGAEKSFQRGLELSRSNALVHQWYGLFLTSMGRHEEAAHQIGLARDLDPLALLVQLNEAWTLYFSGRYEEALEQGHEMVRLWPGVGATRYAIGLTYEQLGEIENSVAELEEAVRLSGELPYLVAALGHAYASAGREEEARETLTSLDARTFCPPSLLALVHTGLGEQEQALTRLEEAYEARDAYLVFLDVNPVWNPLREEERFQSLLQHMSF